MNQLFSKASEFTLNPYYKELLNECSVGKFPKGISVDKDTLVFENERIKPKNEKELCSIMLKWFKSLKLEKKENYFPSSPPLFPQECTLKQVPQKSRDGLIYEFSMMKMKELNLSPEERGELYSTIKLGIIFGYIGAHEIFLQDHQIVDIPGIIIRDGHFYIDINRPKHSLSNYNKNSSTLLD